MRSRHKRLIIMRHAKSSWKSGVAGDHDRPLNGRGRNDAPRIAEALDGMGWLPDLIITSDATRARETVECLLEGFSSEPRIQERSDFYLAGLSVLQSVIASVSDTVDTLMVVGHNPGWENAVSTLTGEVTHMTTANAALMVAPSSKWADAMGLDEPWTLERVLRPKEL